MEIFYSYYKPLNINEFKNKELLALAGIGNPENFFSLIENYELEIEKKLEFPDHYQFSKKEIVDIIQEAEKNNLQVILQCGSRYYDKYKNFNSKLLKVLPFIKEMDKAFFFLSLD